MLKLFKKKEFLGLFAILGYFVVAQLAFASTDPGTDTGIAGMANSVTGSFTALGKLMIAAAYIGGFALTIASIFKFKAHKDNPQQVPMGLPIALLAIGIVLVFLPTLFGAAGDTAFGGDQQAGGFEGGGADNIAGTS